MITRHENEDNMFNDEYLVDEWILLFLVVSVAVLLYFLCLVYIILSDPVCLIWAAAAHAATINYFFLKLIQLN